MDYLAILIPVFFAVISGLMQHKSKSSALSNLVLWISGWISLACFFGLFMYAGAGVFTYLFASGSQHVGLLLFLLSGFLSAILTVGIAGIVNDLYITHFLHKTK